VVGYSWLGNGIRAHKAGAILRVIPSFSPKFSQFKGEINDAPPRKRHQKALRVLYGVASEQTVMRADRVNHNQQRLILRCPLSAQNIAFCEALEAEKKGY